MSQELWFHGLNNKQHGPITKEELIYLLKEGELKPDTLVWNESLENWTAASQVEELFSALKEQLVPPLIPQTTIINDIENTSATQETPAPKTVKNTKKKMVMPIGIAAVFCIVVIVVLAVINPFKKAQSLAGNTSTPPPAPVVQQTEQPGESKTVSIDDIKEAFAKKNGLISIYEKEPETFAEYYMDINDDGNDEVVIYLESTSEEHVPVLAVYNLEDGSMIAGVEIQDEVNALGWVNVEEIKNADYGNCILYQRGWNKAHVISFFRLDPAGKLIEFDTLWEGMFSYDLADVDSDGYMEVINTEMDLDSDSSILEPGGLIPVLYKWDSVYKKYTIHNELLAYYNLEGSKDTEDVETPIEDPAGPSLEEGLADFERLINKKSIPGSIIWKLESIIDQVSPEDGRSMVIQLQDYIEEVAIPRYEEMLWELGSFEYFDEYMLDQFNNRPYEIEDQDLRDILKMVRSEGMLVYEYEGDLYLELDYTFFPSKFMSVYQEDELAFFELQNSEFDKPVVEDMALLVSWDELAQRIYELESFIDRYPHSEHASTVREVFEYYTYLYLVGLDNSPAFDDYGYTLIGEVFKSYQRTIKNYPESELASIIDDCLSELERSDYKTSQDYFLYVEEILGW